MTNITVTDGAQTPTTLSSIDYTYDIFNRRIAKEIDSDGDSTVDEEQFYIYDGQHIVLQFDGSAAGDLTNRYLHGPAIDQILADEQIDSSEILWPATDHLGTVRDLVDSSGNVNNHIDYDSFGKLTAETASTVDHIFGYTGRERDEESDLYYYRARYYDAGVGRFVSEDPIGFAASDANLNRYVGNSSPNRIDPSGNDWLDNAANFSAGWGDTLTFGGTDRLRYAAHQN